MHLQHRTIQKLLRETFPGGHPLVLTNTERAKVARDLKARLERFEGVDTKDQGSYYREEEKARFVCSFSITDPTAKYYYRSGASFRLLLDDSRRLTIEAGHRHDSALVSDLEEVVEFVRQIKQRLDRQKALEAKRGKVRDLLAQAILAQVRKVAREERFDFMSETREQKLDLFVKLSDQHAVELHIPFKEFKKFLPQLRSVIVTLRELYQNGIRFQIVGRRKLPWRKSWVTHESLREG